MKTPQNTYLIPLMGKGEVVEMNKNKEIVNRVVWTLPLHPDIVNISTVYSFQE